MGYVPWQKWECTYPLDRAFTAEKLGFENVLVQTADSADESFIPKFEK